MMLLIGIGGGIYSNIFQSPFILDDGTFILENPPLRITEISCQQLSHASLKAQPKTRYIPKLSFALNYYFNRYEVFGYHLVNLIIHVLTAIFLMLVIQKTLHLFYPNTSTPSLTLNPALISFFAATIWLTHPIQTNAVTYTCQRQWPAWRAMFFILSMLMYVNGRISLNVKPRKKIQPLFVVCRSRCIRRMCCGKQAEYRHTAHLHSFIRMVLFSGVECSMDKIQTSLDRGDLPGDWCIISNIPGTWSMGNSSEKL